MKQYIDNSELVSRNGFENKTNWYKKTYPEKTKSGSKYNEVIYLNGNELKESIPNVKIADCYQTIYDKTKLLITGKKENDKKFKSVSWDKINDYDQIKFISNPDITYSADEAKCFPELCNYTNIHFKFITSGKRYIQVELKRPLSFDTSFITIDDIKTIITEIESILEPINTPIIVSAIFNYTYKQYKGVFSL